MDLKEADKGNPQRHPWETARLRALRNILSPTFLEGMKILDIGCGDGFVVKHLFRGIGKREITAVDTNLSDEWISQLSCADTGITFQRDMPGQGSFDTALLLDVLEHVEDDRSLLRDIASRYLSTQGIVMITVPAFQSIYSEHDAFLGHYRRYSLQQLVQLVTACGLEVRRSGYLFSSLLLPKLVLYKLLKSRGCADGIGQWRRGRWLTSLVERALDLDNMVLLAAGRLGIKIPGLTVWVLCEKRG